MKIRRVLERALTPDGKVVLLEEHDGAYYIRVDGVELMSTRQHGSEEKLAELACAHLAGVAGARVLVGGLGFGFTLRSALGVVRKDAEVILVEILGAVVEWNRNPNYGLGADALLDARVSVVQGDVGVVIRDGVGRYDGIVLDVDNGPAGLSFGGNEELYGAAGLRRMQEALRPGGCVTVWSAAPDFPFERAMRSAGFGVEVLTVRARVSGGRRHTVFLGRV